MIEGLTETEVLKVIDSVVNQLAPNYVFGYYTLDDIKQEGRIFGLEAIPKFDITKGKTSENRNTISDRLFNFLRTHIQYRYCTLIRDNFERSELPNCNCYNCLNNNLEECPRYKKFLNRNLAKKQIAGPAHETIDIGVSQASQLESKEMFTLLNKYIPANLRTDFRKLIDGVKISNTKKQKLREVVSDILLSGVICNI